MQGEPQEHIQHERRDRDSPSERGDPCNEGLLQRPVLKLSEAHIAFLPVQGCQDTSNEEIARLAVILRPLRALPRDRTEQFGR